MIEPKELSRGPLDNRDQVLEQVWERVGGDPDLEMVDGAERTMELVKTAREMIVLWTPQLLHGELKVALEKVKDDVRVYALTSSVSIHHDANVLERGVMREVEGQESTFVLIDPRTAAHGIWFPGHLTSKRNQSTIVLDLSEDQVQEAWTFFSHHFWASNDRELFMGQTRRSRPLKPAAAALPQRQDHVFTPEAIEDLFGEGEISRLWYAEGFQRAALDYVDEAEELVVVPSEAVKEDIDWEELEGKAHGIRELPSLLATVADTTFVQRGLFGLQLTPDQVEAMPTPEYPWVFRDAITIGEVEGDLILMDQDWGPGLSRPVKDSETVSLGTLTADSIEEWSERKPEPEIPDELRLAREVLFEWTLEPPYAPAKARAHAVYQVWDRYREALETFRDELVSRIEGDLYEKPKGKKEIAHNAYLDEIRESLGEVEIEEFPSRDAAQTSADDLLELDARLKGQEGEAASEPNELEALGGRSGPKKGKKGKGKKSDTNLKDLVPDRLPPSVGHLVEQKNKAYLEIDSLDELNEANKEAKRFRAKVVARRGS